MSVCKACKTEIDPQATKCPHCQAFQQWYRNPQAYGLLFALPLFFLVFWQLSTLRAGVDYADYVKGFTVEKVGEVETDGGAGLQITYKITNGTEHKWDHLSYQMVGKNEKGELVLTEWGSEYAWVIQPHADAYVTVRLEPNDAVHSWEFSITDLDTSRF